MLSINICIYSYKFQELDRLDKDGTVYKMIGPVLVKQNLDESKQNVQKRIDYIADLV
jgi:prefoldin beta subunit